MSLVNHNYEFFRSYNQAFFRVVRFFVAAGFSPASAIIFWHSSKVKFSGFSIVLGIL